MNSNTSKELDASKTSSSHSEESFYWKEFYAQVQASIGRAPRTEIAHTSWEEWQKSQALKKIKSNEREG